LLGKILIYWNQIRYLGSIELYVRFDLGTIEASGQFKKSEKEKILGFGQ